MNIEGIEVLQAEPGRLNLSVAKLKGNAPLAEKFQTRFAGIQGITRVEVNPERGEVEMHYNKGEITSLRSMWDLKDAMSTFFPEVNAMQLAAYFGQYL